MIKSALPFQPILLLLAIAVTGVSIAYMRSLCKRDLRSARVGLYFFAAIYLLVVFSIVVSIFAVGLDESEDFGDFFIFLLFPAISIVYFGLTVFLLREGVIGLKRMIELEKEGTETQKNCL